MMRHHLLSYVRRFRLEWIVFLFTSIAASVLTLRWPEHVPDLPCAVLEGVAFAWFTLCVMQAEPVFQTHGGWRVRPVPPGALKWARRVFFLSALLPAMLIRGWCLHKAVDLSGMGWVAMLWRVWLPWLAMLLAAAAVVSYCGRHVRETGNRRWLMVLSGLIAAVVIVSVGAGIMNASASRSISSSGSYSRTPAGVRPHLPPGERLITLNDSAGGSSEASKPLRPLLRLPLKSGSTASRPELRVNLKACQPDGLRLAFTMQITGTSRALHALGENPLLAVRYPGGIWAPQLNHSHRWHRSRLAGMGYVRLEESGDFMSPMMEPWNRRSWAELLAGAELVLFELDPDGKLLPPEPVPPFAWSVGEKETTLELPELPPQPTLQQLRKVAQAAVDQLHVDQPHAGAGHEHEQRGIVLLEKAGAAIVEPVLGCGPFGAGAWATLEWFLTKHATAAHLPALLRLLEKDGRAGSVMVKKGWKAEALPLLRRHLHDGLPLTMPGLLALAEQKDAALAPALRQRLLIFGNRGQWHDQDHARLADALREHPGIEWTTLLRDYWYARGRGQPWTEKCAATGDRNIFREMAGYWLRASKLPGKNTLHTWIAASAWDGELSDFPAWLRANFDRLIWDAAAARWTTP